MTIHGTLAGNLADHWHKVVALLMHEFEITEFEINEATLKAFSREYDGQLPTVVTSEKDGVLKVRLMTHEQASRLTQ